ncbi:MAG: hypothetical protein K6G33_07880 [Ruminococcus sp.]|uniref:hypothetical protein n=1 Tax=Ruminococcus sp. TaxID=41978 RepID=UPI0025FE2223|nr:hypothetical protein [Ruminococcus sp.]MCR5600643.1 hypothetical protein [Ruminococcus sp.]
MKLTTKILSAITAAAISAGTSPLFPAAANAADTMAVKLPNWIPQDFESALEFRNTYGDTHIQNGCLCVLFTESSKEVELPDDEKVRYTVCENEYADYGDHTETLSNVFAKEIFHETFTVPDEMGTSDLQFEVVVYLPEISGRFDVTLYDATKKYVNCIMPTYSFWTDGNYTITETDLHG